MESDWHENFNAVDYRARPVNDRRKPRPFVRNRLTLKGPPPGWSRHTKQEDNCPTPNMTLNKCQWWHPNQVIIQVK